MKKILVLIGLLVIDGVLWDNAWYSLQTTIAHDNVQDLQSEETELRQNLIRIKEYIKSQHFHSEQQEIDFIRNWVYKNSIHKIDAEHNQYAFDIPRVLSMLWSTHQTSRGHPHLSCGPRTYAMQTILNDFGIPNRIIMTFSDKADEIQSHTFLEVFNRESGDWEVQGPDHDICYIDIHNWKRASAARLFWGDLNCIIPVSSTKKGWEENNVGQLKRDYLGAMMYRDLLDGEKSVILINLTKFSPTKIFEKNNYTSFYEFARKTYRNPVFITCEGGVGVGNKSHFLKTHSDGPSNVSFYAHLNNIGIKIPPSASMIQLDAHGFLR
jgi:hypothetical protein